MRLIYYSVALTPDGKYDRQWIQSIRSLRQHNSAIRVLLFVFDNTSNEVIQEVQRQNVSLRFLGSYQEWLGAQHPMGHVLGIYPTLHNLLVLRDSDLVDVDQILYVDCDTFFFGDPGILFASRANVGWCAKEIPGSQFATTGPTGNFNPRLVHEITQSEKLQQAAAFNTGVCLFDRKTMLQIISLKKEFLDMAWRLIVGMLTRGTEPVEGAPLRDAAERRTFERKVESMRETVMRAASPTDLNRALPYPSDNWWILDEIAWVLTSGRILDLSQQYFTSEEVTQGDEFVNSLSREQPPILAHYFSTFESKFFQHVRPIAASEAS